MFLYDDKEFVGKKIKQLRTNAGLSQAELSEKIGMTEKNLSNIERGLQYPALNSFLNVNKQLVWQNETDSLTVYGQMKF